MVLPVPVETINALSQLGFTGGAVLVILLLVTGKLTAGFLLDRSETRAEKLQSALDKAAEVNGAFPKAIAELNKAHGDEVALMNAAHEREVAALSVEVRRLQDMIGPHR